MGLTGKCVHLAVERTDENFVRPYTLEEYDRIRGVSERAAEKRGVFCVRGQTRVDAPERAVAQTGVNEVLCVSMVATDQSNRFTQ